MSQVVIAGDVSGTITLQAPSVAGTTVLTLPTTSGTLAVGSSAMTKIATLTGNNTSPFSFTGLSGYDKYMLVLDSLTNSAGNYACRFYIGYGSTPTYLTSGYNNVGFYTDSAYSNPQSVSNGASPAAYGAVTNNVVLSTGLGVSGFMMFENMNQLSGTTVGIQSNIVSQRDAATHYYVMDQVNSLVTSSNLPTAIQIYFNGGVNITTGSATLYGITS